MAVERYHIKIELIGGIGVLLAEIERIHSPITIERLTKKIPFSARGRFFIGGKDYFMIPVKIKKGNEKPKISVKKGNLVYEPSSDSLMICLKEGNTPRNLKVSLLGEITEGLEHFDKVKRSNGVKISFIK